MPFLDIRYGRRWHRRRDHTPSAVISSATTRWTAIWPVVNRAAQGGSRRGVRAAVARTALSSVQTSAFVISSSRMQPGHGLDGSAMRTVPELTSRGEPGSAVPAAS
jgi:hypothetical protein